MSHPQRYNPAEAEHRWQATWSQRGLYRFDPADQRPIFAIDTPPPTVSGALHIGHVYSYVQAEAMVRFWRMQGYNIYYPFGFDDNGLPTERFVERSRGIRARDVGRAAFITACLETTEQIETQFETFWQRLGISADWRLRYSTISEHARRMSQWSFLDLYRKGRIYRAQAPNPWCWECGTAIAQAEMDDAERETTFYALQFEIADGGRWTRDGDGTTVRCPPSTVPIATTRPELLPACVAVFVHPEDERYRGLIGQYAVTPLLGRHVPILADPLVDRAKGSGAVMCCTFGDTTDVAWWRAHDLPLIPLISREGRLSEHGGAYAGLNLKQARTRIVADLRAAGAITGEHQTQQSVRIHERCGTPLEILETNQWFIRVLDMKPELLAAGRAITWHPAFMQTRYEHWVENLAWDWSISRQRFYGVPFPLWYCDACGAVVLADETLLPVDPLADSPPHACVCGNTALRPEQDVMDTWATSSVSPQLAGQMLDNPALFERLFPFALRPQAHDIIRTWAFDTIVKSLLHHNQIPWRTLLIAGHGLDPAGRKLSKSKNNAPTAPDALIERYGADAVRYWACGGAPGADQLLDEDAMKRGSRLVNKLWNASRLIAETRRGGDDIPTSSLQSPASTLHIPQPTVHLPPLDRALLSWLQRLILNTSKSMHAYDYPAALAATERFFWATLCDNYLELIKGRLYDGSEQEQAAAARTLHAVLGTLLKLFAPFLPHISEEIWSLMYASDESSIHLSTWPEADTALIDEGAEQVGEAIFTILAQTRRAKTERKASLGTPLASLQIGAPATLHAALANSTTDLRSATRAAVIRFINQDTIEIQAHF